MRDHAWLWLHEEMVGHCKAHHARCIVYPKLALFCNLLECRRIVPC